MDDENGRSSVSSNGDMFYRFQGDANLFDVWKEEDNHLSLVVVDDKSRIHFRTSEDRFASSKSKIMFEHKITEICKHKCWSFVGCSEGHIFKLSEKDPENKELVCHLDGSVMFMESIMGKFVVAGTSSHFQILEVSENQYEGRLVKCFLLDEDYLICVKADCDIDVS